jgi:hypothetical protein
MRLRPLLYARLSANELALTDLRNGRSWRGPPVLAVEMATKRILKLGREAAEYASDSVTVMNGFAELSAGRISNPDTAALALRLAANDVLRRPLFVIRPDLVIHPVIAEGRRSSALDIELCGLGKVLSARRCTVWYGGELDVKSAEEIIDRAMSSS